MPVQRPLVSINGKIVQLPIDDIITGYENTQSFRTGRTFTVAQNHSAVVTLAFPVNRLYSIPFWVSKTVTILSARIEVTTLAATALLRLGIYNSGLNGLPGTLVLGSDAGTFDLSSVGVKTVTYASAITLQPGLYWQAANQSVGGAIRAIPVNAIEPVLGCTPAMGAGAAYSSMTVGTFGFSAMPATFPAASRELNIAAALVLYMVQ